jgi:hypothetical protein
VKVAWVSCIDEPTWADECMRKFKTPMGMALVERIDGQCIYKANKQKHFKDLLEGEDRIKNFLSRVYIRTGFFENNTLTLFPDKEVIVCGSLYFNQIDNYDEGLCLRNVRVASRALKLWAYNGHK